MFRSVNDLEDVFILLVNEDALELGEKHVCALDKPINQMLVKTTLGKYTRTSLVQLVVVAF